MKKDHPCRYHVGNFNGYTRSFYDRVSLNGREWISSRLRRIAAATRRSMAASALADMLSPLYGRGQRVCVGHVNTRTQSMRVEPVETLLIDVALSLSVSHLWLLLGRHLDSSSPRCLGFSYCLHFYDPVCLSFRHHLHGFSILRLLLLCFLLSCLFLLCLRFNHPPGFLPHGRICIGFSR
jgi:hypothetical protein